MPAGFRSHCPVAVLLAFWSGSRISDTKVAASPALSVDRVPQQNVLGFDVAVNDLALMYDAQRYRDIGSIDGI